MKTIKKIFALILLFALLLSASAFLTSFRSKEPTPYFSEPAPCILAPTLSIKNETVSVDDDVVLLVNYDDILTQSDFLPEQGMRVTVKIDMTLFTTPHTLLYRLDLGYDLYKTDEELVIPLENLKGDSGELTFTCQVREYPNRNYYGTFSTFTSTKHLHYQREGDTFQLSWVDKTDSSSNPTQDPEEPTQNAEEPRSFFGCAARPISAENSEQKKSNGGGGSSTGNGTQSGM